MVQSSDELFTQRTTNNGFILVITPLKVINDSISQGTLIVSPSISSETCGQQVVKFQENHL